MKRLGDLLKLNSDQDIKLKSQPAVGSTLDKLRRPSQTAALIEGSIRRQSIMITVDEDIHRRMTKNLTPDAQRPSSVQVIT